MNNNAILVLKSEVKISASIGNDIRQKIQTLKFGSTADCQRYHELRNLKGILTRAARKALLDPETGPERSELWDRKRTQGKVSRHCLLAYGFLRGRPYKSIERKYGTCAGYPNRPDTFQILALIQKAFESSGEAVPPEITCEAVNSWLEADIILEAAAE